MNYSYATVITNKKYYPGLCALNYSLMRVGAAYPLTVIVPHSMDAETKQLIQSQNVNLVEMEDLHLSEEVLSKNPEQRWNETLFKIAVFNLTQFDKVVLLDLDMIILNNIDELFDKPHMSSVAAGHCMNETWNRLNSGMIVIEPNEEIYKGLQACVMDAYEERIQSGLGFGDQDVINHYYKDWSNRKDLWLDETYNCMVSCVKQISSMYGYKNIKIIHFAIAPKPWQFTLRNMCFWLVKGITDMQFAKIKVLMVYLKYLHASCPGFPKYR